MTSSIMAAVFGLLTVGTDHLKFGNRDIGECEMRAQRFSAELRRRSLATLSVWLLGLMLSSAAFAFAVYGAIGDKYRQLGGEGSPLGAPMSDEADAPYGGRFNKFQYGFIYWHPSIGAFAVYGAIGEKWNAYGRVEGYGYPITDELKTPDGRGRYNHFRKIHVSGKPEQSIYWAPETGAHVIYGAIRDKWAATGRERGPLGYPTSDEFQDGQYRRSNFEHGYIRCCERGAEVVLASSDGGGGGGGGLSADAQAILNAHNGYRAKHCVPLLTWSAQLAAGAQAWANRCERESGGAFKHSYEPGVGENLYWAPPGAPSTGKDAVDWFYGEAPRYDYNNPYASFIAGDDDRNREVRHFTQLVWRATAQVGCAKAQCGNITYWVCRYAPPGNWNANVPGELAKNVPPPCK